MLSSSPIFERRGEQLKVMLPMVCPSLNRECQKLKGGGLYLSTLGNYVAALGGELQIIAVFPEDTISLTNPQIT
jgi:hypothetical protein